MEDLDLDPTPLRRAHDWLSRSLFNTSTAGAYFEPLVERILPTWSLVERKARVLSVVDETADTRTFLLRTSRGFGGFVAGQHVHVVVRKNGARETRTFSISSCPAEWRRDRTLSLTVKRVPGGRVTGFMHDHLRPGDVVGLSGAQGEFVPSGRTSEPVAYLAAGSGITPVMSHLRQMAEEGMPAPVTLLYFANGRRDFIFGDELRSLRDRFASLDVRFVPSHDPDAPAERGEESPLPRTTLAAIHVRALLEGAPERVFLCGPLPFREVARRLLASAELDPAKLVEESYGPAPWVAPEGSPVTVTFRGSQSAVFVAHPRSLLELAERAGVSPRHGCRMGICHTCKCTKVSGQVRDVRTGALSGPGREDVQICVSVPVTDVELEL